MHSRQSFAHLISSLVAVAADALAIFLGLKLALWIRFSEMFAGISRASSVPEPSDMLEQKLLAMAVFLLVFQRLGLYQRPHQGRLEDKIPRILRAILISMVLYFAAEAATRLDPEFSRWALFIGLFTVTVFVLLERWIIFRIELHRARHAEVANKVLVIGTDETTLRLVRAIEGDPFLRSRVAGYVLPGAERDWPEEVPASLRLGRMGPQLTQWVEELGIHQLVLSDTDLDRDVLMEVLLLCEQRYLHFSLVPDLFRMLTGGVQMQQFGGVQVMGLQEWPLDRMGARMLKRTFDIVFSLVALLLTSPVLLLAALAVKVTSPGPVFYLQERCGEKGTCFQMIKLRTMRADAESTGPGWTRPDDPRRTPVGGFLRKWNLDELPQFLNVLAGHMSVVGPRPERPVYVERFKDDIDRYMRRHNHKPGITGWAQVHGFRGDTSIRERLRFDLFYLENWSIGLDIKIIIKTLVSRENAY